MYIHSIIKKGDYYWLKVLIYLKQFYFNFRQNYSAIPTNIGWHISINQKKCH